MIRHSLELVAAADPGPGGLSGEVIAFANSGRFDSAFYNVADTNYTVGGWDRDPLQEILEFFAPAYPTADRFHYKAAQHAEDFLTVTRDQLVRPMGAPHGKLQPPRMSEVNETLDEIGLTMPVDKREVDEDPQAIEKAMMRLSRIILRAELLFAVGLLKAAATNTDKTWTGASDPDSEVSAEMLDVENTVGLRPSRLGFGSKAWSIRQSAVRAGDKAGNFASANWTTEQVANFVGAQTLAVTEARYRSAVNTLSAAVGDQVIMFQAETGGHKDDPSNIKRFTGTISGQALAVYRQEFARHWEVTLSTKSKTKITSTLGIRKFTVSAS